jgi:protein-S-isoprenylcysteine O-methyltransferase Ste14
MSERLRDQGNWVAGVDRVAGVGMAEPMGRHGRVDARSFGRCLHDVIDPALGQDYAQDSSELVLIGLPTQANLRIRQKIGFLMTIAAPAGFDDAALSQAQFRRRLTIASAILVMSFLLLFVGSGWRADSPRVSAAMEWLGLVLIALAIAGRSWCAIYIGGRKKVDLVTKGPYSLVRHPLYVFSIIGAAGIGALWGSIVVSMSLALITAAILYSISKKEEVFMLASFGEAYEAYTSRVRRFIPRFGTWSDADVVTARPSIVVRTFFQSSLFLLGVPAAELVQWAHSAKVLPILVQFS